MSFTKPKVGWAVVLVLVAGSIVYDAMFHFDSDLIQVKRAHSSAQRHWNLFYGQEYVFNDSSIKYQGDIEAMRPLIEPNSVLLSDISTSYYIAAQLPVFLPNIHRHHKRHSLHKWRDLLDSKAVCQLDEPEQRARLKEFIQSNAGDITQVNAEFRYMLVNKDQDNINMRNDCLSQTRSSFVRNVNGVANTIYDGEFLRLYRIID